MDQDLTQKLDHLYAMKMQPALHIFKKFDYNTSKIDYDSEPIMGYPIVIINARDNWNNSISYKDQRRP